MGMIKKVLYCEMCDRRRTLREMFKAKLFEYTFGESGWSKRVYRLCSTCWYVKNMEWESDKECIVIKQKSSE